jgi:lipopolysaccharide export system ATP-binding protein
VEEPVLARLEAAGVARREPSPPGPERLRIDPGLWAQIEPRKPEIVEELSGVVRVLQQAPSPNPVAVQPDALPAGGSRLRADGLVKVYRRRTVVNDVAIAVAQGEIVALLGPNGAGKTTTFYMIVGLIPPDAGRVHLDETDITETPMYQRARMGVGYLAQEPSIFRKLTVEGNVRAILETLELPKDEERRRLETLLDELSIAHLRTHKADSLSGGERRRLEITRALVQRPKFILLDEPFAGIDPIAVGDIQKIVADLKKRGIGVIISDHNVEQTLEIVDRAYIMYEGRIRVSGTVSELVWSEEVAEIYLGPTMTARMRKRYPRPAVEAVTQPMGAP